MATRLKTVNYGFNALATLTSGTLTTLTQITVYLPETGTKTFRSVIARVSMDDISTSTAGTITTKTVNLRLSGAGSYSTRTNANNLVNSGEGICLHWLQDFTDYFQSTWTGTSMLCDVQLQFANAGSDTPNFRNVSVTLDITYEYDDTSTTQVKTVWIPLNAPVGGLTATATTYDTAPNLSTYLPEASKTFRYIGLVVQGNENKNAVTTDYTLTLNMGTATVTTGSYEGGLGSDRFYRYVWNLTTAWPSTSATQTFQASTSTATRHHHFQAWLMVTYEFSPSSSTRVMNSLVLPMEMDSPMGSSAADYQRAERQLYIQEPGTITTERVAFYPFWEALNVIAGLNFRLGTGSWTTYTDNLSQACGMNAAMVRNDTAFTLARGKNTLTFDAYRTDTAMFGWAVTGFWIVNYSSDIASSGVGSHNHSILYKISSGMGNNTTAASNYTYTANIPIPETEYYINGIGAEQVVMTSGTVQTTGQVLQLEKANNATEGGLSWESVYLDTTQTDAEVGARLYYSQARDFFKRWPNDPGPGRVDLETDRRWRQYINWSGTTTAASMYAYVGYLLTYHSITYTIAGTISGSAGGTVNIDAWRTTVANDQIYTTSRTGDGSYSISWYDNTVPVIVTAYENSTHKGMSIEQVAGNTFDIDLSGGSSGGPTYYSFI